jgi:hypothetical protein
MYGDRLARGRPWYKCESKPIVDHRITVQRRDQALTHCTHHIFARLCRPIGYANFSRQSPRCRIQFAGLQCVEQALSKDDALALPPRQTFTRQMSGAFFYRTANLGAEPAAKITPSLAKIAAIKPGHGRF